MSFFNFLQGAERQLNPLDNNATYKNPRGNGQNQSVANQAGSFGLNFLKSAVVQPAHTVYSAAAAPVRLAAGEISHNDQAIQNARQSAPNPLQFGVAAGQLATLGLGGPIAKGAETAASGIFGFLAPKIASEAVGSAAAKTALGVGGDLLPKGVNTAIKLGAGPAAGAAIGGPYNAATSTVSGQPITGQSLLHSGLQGVEAGAGLGLVGEAVPLATKGVLNAGRTIAENTTPLNEIGALGKNVTADDLGNLSRANTLKDVNKALTDIVPPDVAAKIAPAILKTKDPGIIDNIITKAVTPAAPISDVTVPPPVVPARDVSAVPESQAAGATPPPSTTEPIAPSEAIPTGTRERGYTTSQKAAENYSPELKAAIGGEYAPAGGKSAIDNANQLIDKQGVDTTHQQILEKLQSGVQPTKQDIITGGMVVSHLDSQGRVPEAEQLHQLLAEKGTASGQTSEAFKVLLQLNPEHLVYKAKNDITKAQGKLTPEVEDTLNNFKENIRETAPGSPDRTEGVQQLQEFVNKQIPASFTDKAFAVWRAGLLTGPQTVAKIITSHIVHGGLEDLKDVPGAAVDKFISLFTGQRTLAASERGSLSGTKQGAVAGKELLTTGRDVNPGSNASELRQTINFGKGPAGRFLQKYVDTVGGIHGSLYKPFYGKAYAQSLYNTAIAEAKNRGLTGADRESFIQDVVDDPSADVAKIAKRDAENATFQQETALGNIASAIQKKGGIIGKVLAPFTRIPSAIATDLFNYSPAGLAKTIIDGIKNARSDEGLTFETQRQLSQGIGRGLVGSAVVIPGIALYNRGLMTLDYPTDPKEQKLWQLEGKIPNAIKVGGQWRSLGAIGPAGSVLSIGGHLAKSLAEGNDIGSALISGFAGGARSIEEQSYLQGISGSLNALNDPGRYSKNFIKQEAGSVVPTLSNTIAAATDKYSRQTVSPVDAIKNRIPGLRESLPVKVNSLGQPVLAPETGIEKLIDPFQSSTVRSSPIITELRRLQDAGQGITPATVNKKITFSKVNTEITPVQQQELTKAIGEATLQRWHDIISQPGYQSASDAQKSARLKSSFDIISQHQKILFAKSNKVGRYSPNYATNRAAAKANKKFVVKSGG